MVEAETLRDTKKMVDQFLKDFPVPVLAEPDKVITPNRTGEAREALKSKDMDALCGTTSRGGEFTYRLENRLAPFDHTPPTSAKQLNITLIDNKLAGRLNKAWHSRVPEITWGGTACNPCFAAVYNNVIYAVAMWSCPIAGNRITDGFRCLELRRMAIASDAPKNLASRFLAIMVKEIRKARPDIIRLISYQDTAVHKGTIYKASGWILERTTEFVSWGITGRKGHGKLDYQAPSPKNRWALTIREKGDSDKLIAPSESQGDLF